MTTATPTLATLLTQLAQALTEQHQHPPRTPEPRPMPQRVLLTVEEAAQLLGIGRTKAFELVGSGELTSVLVGRLRRVPASAITEYAARLIAEQRSAD